MRNLQLAAGLAAAVLASAAGTQARADVYDYGYGPVYGYPVVSGTSTCPTCPSGQCSGTFYSPTYSSGYPIYSTQCPNGLCGANGTCTSGTCGVRGQCSGGQCSGGQCSGGLCTSGQCTNGSCRSGRCGTCPSGDCERGHCSGNCPNGQCSVRYRGSDPLSRPASPSFDRSDYGPPDAASYRPTYSDRPFYRDSRDRDYRDARDRDIPISRRSWRSDPRPSRDSELESPFYN